MKYTGFFILFGAAVLPLQPLFAEDAASPSAAVQHGEFLSFVRESMVLMGRISSLADSVKDTAGAEAAAPELASLVAKLAVMYAAGRAMAELAVGDDAELAALETAHEAAEERLFESMMRLQAADCYGSEALRRVVELF